MSAVRVQKPPSPQAGRVSKRARSTRKTEPQAPADSSPPAIDVTRRAMIAEAAYYRAQRRGFEPGYELDDWVSAEAEIERATPRHRGEGPSLCGD